MTEAFEFRWPWLLGLVLPALALLWATRGRDRPRVWLSSVSLVRDLPRSLRERFAWIPEALLAIGVVCAVLALARPRLGDERTVVHTEGIAIELVVDLSRSMLAHDFQDEDGRPIDRLEAVKHVVQDFVQGADDLPGRPSDLIGLTVFAGYSEPVVPPTLDHGLLLSALRDTQIVQGRFEDGTSVAQGLAVALGRLRESEAESRVVVLLTDGEHNDETTDPLEVAELAAELDVRVYTVGMGALGQVPYPIEGPDGRIRWQQIRTNLDETLLREIATRTGGLYQRAGSTEDLRAVYAEIDRLERTEVEGFVYSSWRELYAWPLALGLFCWSVSFLLDLTWLGRLA